VILVTYGDGKATKASGVGTIRIKGDQGQVITLTGVLWISSNAMCLFSIKRVSGREGTTIFHNDKCMIYQGRVLVFHTVKDPHSNYLSNTILETGMLKTFYPLDSKCQPAPWSTMLIMHLLRSGMPDMAS
jgi:hypothetical protein